MSKKQRLTLSVVIAAAVFCAVALVSTRATTTGRAREIGAGPSAGATAPLLPGSPESGQLYFDLAANPAQTEGQKAALLKALRAAVDGQKPSAALKIDYPFAGSLYPPDMVPPTFLFHDAAAGSVLWLVDIAAAGGTDRLSILTDGRRPAPELDERCGSPNDNYREPEYQASAKGWTPDEALWSALARKPETDITVTVYGLAKLDLGKPAERVSLLSRGTVTFRVSKDPVGAPIFYRDVPLLPTANEKGVVKPLPDGALPLIEWRLRDLAKPASAVVLSNMPTCANCHSFSNDGKYLGMDMDGPSGDKGAYAMAPVEPKMVIEQKQVFTWNNFNPKWETFGLFSRVSPDGRYVVSAVNESIFVNNYLDFRFLQTFYPTGGILAYYNRLTGKITALPGADKPEYVHGNAVWMPDGKSIIFVRAKARPNVPAGAPPVRANDQNEIQIQYDLCQIPFNDGRGGEARPIPGASGNGKSNSFPKVSPDGKWLVWVQAKTGLLMRPDSELYIMALPGGKPRRMNCNMTPMNSWHSFSPNGRWMVFSSKANTPYTQMFLTHLDSQGNDSPAVLVPHSTADNRAVNIPEFVNMKPDGMFTIDAPAVDYRRHLDGGTDLIRAGRLDEAYREIETADKMRPNFPETLAALGYYYREAGDAERAAGFFEKSLSLDSRNWSAHNYYGVMLFRQGKYDEALRHFQAAIDIYPLNFQALTNSGAVEFSRGNLALAKEHFEKAIEANPLYAEAHYNLALILTREGDFKDAVTHYGKCLEIATDDSDSLGNLAWLLATCPDDSIRNGRRALELAQRLERLAEKPYPRLFDILAAAYAETGQFDKAVQMAERSVQLTVNEDPAGNMRRRLVNLYRSGKPYHGQQF
jgi:Tfp pilus assembly protein PilF